MAKHAEIRIEGSTLHLSGDLDFSNVMSLYRQSLKLFSSGVPVIQVDFSGLASANSVALALMINWMRLAKKSSKTICLKNISQEMMSLANAAGLDKVLAGDSTANAT